MAVDSKELVWGEYRPLQSVEQSLKWIQNEWNSLDVQILVAVAERGST